ncbi:Brain natriuretic peptide B-type natriuretic peptide [Takifugu flavidus]|uniref:Brain natriuretic peptide B-type natriuretic peptide n=1 Tax=Takifugu flavidus TaxID=433684 RepID=A0A5C6MR26_9TELE|nr:Brain natriuretic peptide B-type natriuretic peptide [Takifugu flavidus]
MVVSFVSICGLLLIFNLPLSTSFPVLSDTDVDVLEAILHKLEESMSEETEEDQMVPANSESLEPVGSMKQTANRDQIRPVEMEAIREFLSANTRKNVQNDSSRRSSSCFGRRMDRIGSMSSLGCNTVGKYSKSRSRSTSGTTGALWLTEEITALEALPRVQDFYRELFSVPKNHVAMVERFLNLHLELLSLSH